MQEIRKRAASELRKVIEEAMGPGGISSKVEGKDFEEAQKECKSVIDLMLNPILRESFPEYDPYSATEAYPDFLKALKTIASGGHVSEENANLVYYSLQYFYKIFKPAQRK